MSIESLTQKIQGKIGEDSGLDASIKFNLGDEGVILIDATTVPNRVSNDDREAQCTITVAQGDFESMLAGDLDPTVAFMSGKITVDGDMSVAMKLGTIVG